MGGRRKQDYKYYTGKYYLHWGSQGKHIIGHNNYIPGRSPITISRERLMELFVKYAGTGEKEINKNGVKEKINFHEVIGQSKNPHTGQMENTTWGKIHYDSDGGYHIIPKWSEKK